MIHLLFFAIFYFIFVAIVLCLVQTSAPNYPFNHRHHYRNIMNMGKRPSRYHKYHHNFALQWPHHKLKI